jgi:AcrR family transcriptional regulator
MIIHFSEHMFTRGRLMRDPIHEQLALARRNQILDAATTVFAAKGYHAATIKDIARQAGIADGTIYTYFANKTTLMLGILERMNQSEKREEDFSQFTENDFRGFMAAYFRRRLTALKADEFAIFRVIVSEIMVNEQLRSLHHQKILEPTFAATKKHFQRWAEQHLIEPNNVDLAINAVSGLALGLILQHIMGDKTLNSRWDELPDYLTGLILDGIGGRALPQA